MKARRGSRASSKRIWNPAVNYEAERASLYIAEHWLDAQALRVLVAQKQAQILVASTLALDYLNYSSCAHSPECHSYREKRLRSAMAWLRCYTHRKRARGISPHRSCRGTGSLGLSERHRCAPSLALS